MYFSLYSTYILKIKNSLKELSDLKTNIENFQSGPLNLDSLSAPQINLLQKGTLTTPDDLRPYISEIERIQHMQAPSTSSSHLKLSLDLFDQYATALSDIDGAQAALLLSTQGLTNADIQRTLAAKGLSTEMQYQAMAEAGLLSSKKELLASDLKSILTSQLQSEELANEALASMGLSVATEAEAKELGLTLGVSAATNIQATTTLPKWIASLKASTIAIWEQVAATAIFALNKAIDKHRQKIIETASENIQTIKDNLSNMKSSVEDACNSYGQLQAGVDISTNTNLSLSDEDYQKFLDTNNQLAELFPELIKGTDIEGNAILNLGTNAAETTQILNDLADAKRKALGTEIKNNMTDVMNGIYESTRNAREEIEGFSISSSKSYSENFDSQTMLNSIAKHRQEIIKTVSENIQTIKLSNYTQLTF